MKRCADYNLYESPSSSSNTSSADKTFSLPQAALQRNQKLEKYRQKKELEDRVKELKMVMSKEHIDDETRRGFYVKLLKLSVIDAQEELSSIDQEKQILELLKNRDMMPENQEKAKHPFVRPVRPLKPIIITKDLAQKAVYGLGYPSFPTMTVAEFYDQRVRDGIFPDPNAPHSSQTLQQRTMQSDSSEQQEDIDREAKLEVDDDYEIARLRARDEYKDDHRRGEGNRYNRS